MYGPALLGMLGLALHQSPALMFRPWHRMQGGGGWYDYCHISQRLLWLTALERGDEGSDWIFIYNIVTERNTFQIHHECCFFLFFVFCFPSAEPFSVWKHEAGDILYLSDCQQIPRNEQNKQWMSNGRVKAFLCTTELRCCPKTITDTSQLHCALCSLITFLWRSQNSIYVLQPKIVLTKCTSSPCLSNGG